MIRAEFFQQDSNAGGNVTSSTNAVGGEKNGGSTGGVRSSQVSLSSNPDLDFRYSAIFTEVAFYRGRLLAVKRVRRHHIDINREIKKELKIVSYTNAAMFTYFAYLWILFSRLSKCLCRTFNLSNVLCTIFVNLQD